MDSVKAKAAEDSSGVRKDETTKTKALPSQVEDHGKPLEPLESIVNPPSGTSKPNSRPTVSLYDCSPAL